MKKQAQHRDRMRSFAHTPVEERPHVFRWSAAQDRAGKNIFLRRKWLYDADEIRAYGLNIRVGQRNHPLRYAFRERHQTHKMLGR